MENGGDDSSCTGSLFTCFNTGSHSVFFVKDRTDKMISVLCNEL